MNKQILVACAATALVLSVHPSMASELTFHQAAQKPAGSIFNFTNPMIKIESGEAKGAEPGEARSTTEPPLPTPAPAQKVAVTPLKDAVPKNKVRPDNLAAPPPPDHASLAAPAAAPVVAAAQPPSAPDTVAAPTILAPAVGAPSRPAETEPGAQIPVPIWSTAGMGGLFIGLSALGWWLRLHGLVGRRGRRIDQSNLIARLATLPTWLRLPKVRPTKPSKEDVVPVQAPVAAAVVVSIELAAPIEHSLAWGNRDHAARLISSRRRAGTRM